MCEWDANDCYNSQNVTTFENVLKNKIKIQLMIKKKQQQKFQAST